MAGASCSGPLPPAVVVEARPEVRTVLKPTAPAPWYDPAATRHDFGLVLAGSDVSRTHTFRIANVSARPVRVKGAVNRKPCCGDVAPIVARVVEPGQSVAVAVTLRLGLGAGRVLHVAEVETEEGGSVVIQTTATAHARATCEAVEPTASALDPGQARWFEYVVRTFGRAADPPPPLDDRAIRCGLPTEWVGPPSTRVEDGSGLDEVSRSLAVSIPPASEPGNRTESLEVLDSSGAVVGRRWIAWEVAAAMKASPPGLIFTDETQAAEGLKVIVRARDGRAFQISSATAAMDGLKVAIDGGDARTLHTLTVRFEGAGRPTGPRHGEIAVRTDHPGQPVVKVAVYVIAKTAEVPKRDAPEKPR